MEDPILVFDWSKIPHADWFNRLEYFLEVAGMFWNDVMRDFPYKNAIPFLLTSYRDSKNRDGVPRSRKELYRKQL